MQSTATCLPSFTTVYYSTDNNCSGTSAVFFIVTLPMLGIVNHWRRGRIGAHNIGTIRIRLGGGIIIPAVASCSVTCVACCTSVPTSRHRTFRTRDRFCSSCPLAICAALLGLASSTCKATRTCTKWCGRRIYVCTTPLSQPWLCPPCRACKVQKVLETAVK